MSTASFWKRCCGFQWPVAREAEDPTGSFWGLAASQQRCRCPSSTPATLLGGKPMHCIEFPDAGVRFQDQSARRTAASLLTCARAAPIHADHVTSWGEPLGPAGARDLGEPCHTIFPGGLGMLPVRLGGATAWTDTRPAMGECRVLPRRPKPSQSVEPGFSYLLGESFCGATHREVLSLTGS